MTRSYCNSIILGISVLILLIMPALSFAAIGCTLNDPDRDVKRIFPESTGYRTDFITIEEKDGEELKKEIEEILGDEFDSVYEAIDVPYAYYTILKGKDIIGRVHGVNQKGKYGGMQLILATDTEGKILDFYYQKMSSPEASKFMDKNFTRQFAGLALDDFIKGDINITDPSAKSHEDFLATLRGLKKNLILLDRLMPDIR